MNDNRACLQRGLRDGLPIALGYFAVAFTLGIAAKNAGFTAIQAAASSILNHASAGEYAVIAMVTACAGGWEMAAMSLVSNARYLLMSCALSQKLAPDTSLLHRMLVSFAITDELFGISSAFPGRLNPWYTYAAATISISGWALGSFLGVTVGNILPLRLASALSVGLYGMFLATIVPPSRENRVVGALVLLSFALSFLADRWQLLAGISSGIKTILLTVIISLAASVLFPVHQPADTGEEGAQ